MNKLKPNGNTEKNANELELSINDALCVLVDEDVKADYNEASPDVTLIRKALNTAFSLCEKLDKNFETQIAELLKARDKRGYETGELECIEQVSNIRIKYLRTLSLLRLTLVALYHSGEPFQEGKPSICLLHIRDLLEVIKEQVAKANSDLVTLLSVVDDSEVGGMSVTVIEPRFL